METSGSMKSSIICPDPDSGIGSNGSPRIVRETAKKRQVSPSQTSQNPALISPYRLLSLPDRKSSRRKSGVCFSHFAWHERSVPILLGDCFWGRCPGCNPPSVLSSICLIGEPAPPAEDHRRLLPLSHRCGDHVSSSIFQPSSKLPG